MLHGSWDSASIPSTSYSSHVFSSPLHSTFSFSSPSLSIPPYLQTCQNFGENLPVFWFQDPHLWFFLIDRCINSLSLVILMGWLSCIVFWLTSSGQRMLLINSLLSSPFPLPPPIPSLYSVRADTPARNLSRLFAYLLVRLWHLFIDEKRECGIRQKPLCGSSLPCVFFP